MPSLKKIFATPRRRCLLAIIITIIILILLGLQLRAADPPPQTPTPIKQRDERQFIEFIIAPDPAPAKFRPAGVPQGAMLLEGHIYINLSHVRRVYFQPEAHTADIHMQDAVLLVRFLNNDARAIFRAILSGTPYKAARETRTEVFKEVAAQAGLVQVAYAYELPR